MSHRQKAQANLRTSFLLSCCAGIPYPALRNTDHAQQPALPSKLIITKVLSRRILFRLLYAIQSSADSSWISASGSRLTRNQDTINPLTIYSTHFAAVSTPVTGLSAVAYCHTLGFRCIYGSRQRRRLTALLSFLLLLAALPRSSWPLLGHRLHIQR